MAGQPLQGLSQGQKSLNVGVTLRQLLQTGLLLKGFLQGDIQGIGDHLSDPVHLAVGHIQGPADIPNDGPGLHLSEGNNLGNVVRAVLALDVLDNLIPSLDTKIDVDIWRTHPLGVEEAFEEQAVGQRVNLRNPQAIGHERACARTPSRPHRNVPFFGVTDEIGYDQKVSGKTHLLDHAQLLLEAITIKIGGQGSRLTLRPHFRKAFFQPLLGGFLQKTVQGLSGRNLKLGELQLVQFELQVAALGNFHGVLQGLGAVTEQFFHFFCRTEEKFFGGKLHPVHIPQGFAGLDAKEDLVRFGILPP